MGDAYPEVTVGEVLRARGIADEFRIVAGANDLDRAVRSRSVQRLGVALTGYVEHVDRDRIQIAGNAESGYLATLTPSDRLQLLASVVRAGFPAVVVTSGRPPPPELVELCNIHHVVLITTAVSTAEAVVRLDEYLHRRLAPRESRHGTMVDVYGVGVLLLGKSSIGKSEVALELVEAGHRLVADDVVLLGQEAPGVLVATGEPLARHLMDIRGLGIINVRELFGAAAVRERKRVELAVELVDWTEEADVDLLGLDTRRMELAGVQVPHLRIPVRPGRSLKVIVEVAARNQLLIAQGTHAARAFSDRLNRRLAGDPADPEPPAPSPPEVDRE